MIYRFDKFEVDTQNYQLRKDGVAIEIEPKVFDLLEYLIAKRDKLVTRNELFENLWAGQIVSDSSLGNQIKAVRSAIGDNGKKQSIIKTLHGRGYQFIATIDEQSISDQAGVKPQSSVVNKENPDNRPSIAVLPFANLCGNDEQEYFIDGITEDILIGLCRFRNLLVIARGSSFVFKGQSIDPVEVAGRLGVEYLLEGSVRISGDRVRITAELVNGITGNNIWAETYDRAWEDVFSVQDDVTQRIIATLASRLEKAGRVAAFKKAESNLTVHDLLLRARHYYPDWNGTEEGILLARELYEQAIVLDGNCAAAFSGIACTYNLEYLSDWTRDRHSAGEKAFEFARNALAMDDQDSNAHMVLACSYRDISVNLELAELHLNKAISANPNDYWNYCCLSNLLTIAGKFDESISCSKEAIRRSPMLPDSCHRSIGFAEYFSCNYERALVSFSEILNPVLYDVGYIAACYAQLNRRDEAQELAHQFHQQVNKTPEIDLEHKEDGWRKHLSKKKHFKDKAMIDHLFEGMSKAGVFN